MDGKQVAMEGLTEDGIFGRFTRAPVVDCSQPRHSIGSHYELLVWFLRSSPERLGIDQHVSGRVAVLLKETNVKRY